MANFYILAYDEIPADKNIRVVTTIGSKEPSSKIGYKLLTPLHCKLC